MPNTELTLERVKQLHEAARWAKTHGGGSVTVPADELLALLPPEPKDVTEPLKEPGLAQRERPRELQAATPVEPVAEHGATIAQATSEAPAVPVGTEPKTADEPAGEPDPAKSEPEPTAQ